MRRRVPNRFIATGKPPGARPTFSKRSAGPPCFAARSASAAISSTGSTGSLTRTSSPARLEPIEELRAASGRPWRGDLYQRRRRVSMFVEKERRRAPARRFPGARRSGYNAGPMDRRQQARTLVAGALAEVEAELAAPKYQLCPTQLGACRDTLRSYLCALDAGALSLRSATGRRDLGRIIADSWPFDVPLAALVLRAERAWRNA